MTRDLCGSQLTTEGFLTVRTPLRGACLLYKRPIYDEGRNDMLEMKAIRRFSAAMQRRQTHHERICGDRLEAAGYVIERQVIIGQFIADIVVPARLLVIELDGPGHRRLYDERRDAFMRLCGLNVLRIKNKDLQTTDVEAAIATYPTHGEDRYRFVLGKAGAERGRWMWNIKLKAQGLHVHATHSPRKPKVKRTKAKRQPPVAPSCSTCGLSPNTSKVLTVRNGCQHRVWWCETCNHRVGSTAIKLRQRGVVHGQTIHT